MSAPDRPSVKELALAFLKLGTIAFGGPTAHIAMMEDEFVRRRQWLTATEFTDWLAAANLIPGPSSTEVAIFIGYAKQGWLGLLVAGSCFILPAATLVSLIAAAYVRYGSLPQVEGALHGIKPVVIAIIAQALWSLGRTAIKTKFFGLAGRNLRDSLFRGSRPAARFSSRRTLLMGVRFAETERADRLYDSIDARGLGWTRRSGGRRRGASQYLAIVPVVSENRLYRFRKRVRASRVSEVRVYSAAPVADRKAAD
jgi:chromate transport protein ChrA